MMITDGGKAIRLLMVEDNPDHQSILCHVLARVDPPPDMTIANSGREAIETIAGAGEKGFDCILLDFSLPDYDAPDLLPILRESGASCPIIVVSSSKEQHVVIETMRRGSVDFVPKTEAIFGDVLWERIGRAVTAWQRHIAERRRIVRRATQLVKLTEQDPLTGLSNRRHLTQLLADKRGQHDRRGTTSVLMLDLDHFKEINDAHGHGCGDKVLVAVAEVIRECVGDSGTACRYGGEEFLIVRQSNTQAEAVRWAELLRSRVEGLGLSHGGQAVGVTASIGLVDNGCESVGEESIGRADQALYMAKQLGRNRVCTWPLATRYEADAGCGARELGEVSSSGAAGRLKVNVVP